MGRRLLSLDQLHCTRFQEESEPLSTRSFLCAQQQQQLTAVIQFSPLDGRIIELHRYFDSPVISKTNPLLHLFG